VGANDPQVVEYRDDVQEALDQSLFRVSDARDGATTPQERVRLASILKTMMQGAVEGKSTPNAAREFGLQMMIAGLAPDREAEIDAFTSKFRAALRSMLLTSDLLPGTRKRTLKTGSRGHPRGRTHL
jgi:hypothetical protein